VNTTLKKKEVVASIPMELWQEYEELRQDLRSPSDSYLFTAILQAFMELDPSCQMEVLYGKSTPRLTNPDNTPMDRFFFEGNPDRLLERE
jgi:hypothetical protein